MEKLNPLAAREILLGLYRSLLKNEVECLLITKEKKDDRSRVSFVIRESHDQVS